MTKLANIGDNILFIINTVNAQNGELLYYVANNQPNSAFTTGNTGSFSLASNVGNVSLTIAGGAVFDTDFTLQIRRNSILGPILAESSNVFILAPPPEYTAGWWVGNGTPSTSSRIDRIVFASDTETASVRGPASVSTGFRTGISNFEYGWILGAFGAISIVDRITFTSDTETALVRGSMVTARGMAAGAENDTYGWNAAGIPTTLTSIERLIFSNDTSSTSIRSNFPENKYRYAAVDDDSFGWFAGGYSGTSPGQRSNVFRLSFSDDTTNPSLRGPLSGATVNFTGTGNKTYGWFNSGANTIRLEFSNDSATAVNRSSGISSGIMRSATGDEKNYGWFAGGSGYSIVNRLEFVNDTSSSVRGPMSGTRYASAAVSGAA